MAGDGNLARHPGAKLASPPFHSLTHSHFLPYCLTTGCGCDFRSALEAATAEEAEAFAADLVLPLLLATVWST